MSSVSVLTFLFHVSCLGSDPTIFRVSSLQLSPPFHVSHPLPAISSSNILILPICSEAHVDSPPPSLPAHSSTACVSALAQNFLKNKAMVLDFLRRPLETGCAAQILKILKKQLRITKFGIPLEINCDIPICSSVDRGGLVECAFCRALAH